MGQLRSLIGTMRKKPSKAPDALTDAEATGAPKEKTTIAHDIAHLGLKNAKTIAQALTTLASGEPLDDKKLMLEHGVSMLQSLPLNSGLSADVSGGFIKMLWEDLPHPAATISGPTARYRQHDGSGNNPWNPEMGKAGTPYCRNVPPLKPKGPNLPDPELVYEQLLKRNGPFREHPSGLNRLFFSFATIVIHECFQTSRENQWINETSSYVDLSTLYGNTEKEQVRVRTYENGLIYPDSVASERIMMMPPGVIAVLIMFSRNHNAIAKDLLSINEEGKYKDWNSLNDEQKKWQDNDIFQISRNINVGFFATIVLHDYVAAILNTPRANSTWSLDLGGEIKSLGQRVQRATGNVVSVEFAVLYHWHAALSAADDEWMQYTLRAVLPDLKSMDDLTMNDFLKVVMTAGHMLMSTPPREWTFSGLKRTADGSFNDQDLAGIIKSCVETPAHAFGAHGTPASLRMVDILGMLQARNAFNVCTMNEFREYLNLKTYESFEEWNPDKDVARAAELLYGHIDNLELYPGLMAECTKPAMPGSGVCPGQTTGRGILDDAVALVRGDRFLSYDLNSNTLSNWGIGKISTMPPGTYGGMLPQLLFNGLPGEFTGTSPYALLPFYTPKAAKGILSGNKVLEQYDLARPEGGRQIIGIFSEEGCKRVLQDRDAFRVVYQNSIRNYTDGTEFLIGWDDQKKHDERSKLLEKAFFDEDFENKVFQFFSDKVQTQISEHSLKYQTSRRAIDIVRDVTNVVPILWLAHKFALPIKSLKQPHGVASVPEFFKAFLAVFQYQYYNILPVNEWKLREDAGKLAPPLLEIFRAHLKTQSGATEKIVDWLAKGSAFEVGPDADKLYHTLNSSKIPIEELVGDCLGICGPIVGNISHQASLLVDLFLSPGYEQYKERIIALAQLDDAASAKELEGFVYEGMRHASAVPGVPRVSASNTTIEDGPHGPIAIGANQTVFVSLSKAAMDPKTFPNPEQLDPTRPRSAYTLLGYGMHSCFGARFIGPALAATLKQVFKLHNIRRAPGRQGQFTTLERQIGGTNVRYYIDANAKETPVPTTLTLNYEA